MYEIFNCDCRDAMLHLMDPESVHCVVTSPPYFGLRDYGVPGQIGLEPTPDEFVTAMVDVFRHIRRVLRDDGTVWLNLGDSYANDGKWGGSTGGKHVGALHGNSGVGRAKRITGVGAKQLLGIPWRVAFALQADGWYLRQDIIWHKPNPMPESVRDRCTKAHEYIFLLTKSPRYFFDAEAIKEPGVYPAGTRGAKGSAERAALPGVNSRPPEYKVYDGQRNKRDVWTVAARPYKGAHFATFPLALIEPCVLAGSPPSCCASCDAPRAPVVERTAEPDASYKGSTFDKGKTGARDGGDRTQEGTRFIKRHVGYAPTCACAAPDAPAVVFDPFGGSGTTAVAALRHGRRAVLSELNPEYIELAHARIAGGK